MMWAYIGDGDWELQGSPVLGCIYGSKMDENVKLTLEVVANHTTMVVREITPGPVRVPVEYAEAKMLVEAHMEDYFRNQIANLRTIY